MAIDNPYDQIDQQYPKEAEGVVTAPTRTLEWANDLGVPFPHGVGGLLAVMNSKTINARLERAHAFIYQLVADMQTIQGSVATMRTEMDEVQGAMRISVEYDVDQFNDKRKPRDRRKVHQWIHTLLAARPFLAGYVSSVPGFHLHATLPYWAHMGQRRVIGSPLTSIRV
jgi:hypothetical protein